MQIRCAADFAEWYDTEARQYTDEVLTDFVDANPNLIGVYFASVAANGFDLGSMFFVDVGRLGTGVAEGSAGGFFRDILRALSVMPIGKVASVGKPVIARIARSVADFFHLSRVRGQACVPIALMKAMQATGQQIMIRLDEAAAAMGRTLDNIKLNGARVSELRMGLNSLKAHYDELAAGSAQTWDDIVLYAQNTDGVLLVSLKRLDNVPIPGHEVMVANTAGGVKIFDRYGVFNSLDDLSRRFRIANPRDYFVISTQNPLFIVHNWKIDPSLAYRLDAFGPLGAIVVRASMILGFNPSATPASVSEALRKHAGTNDHASLYPEPTRPPEMESLMYTHTVTGPKIQEQDWLSNIAKRWYGDVLLWPILFDYNRGPDFQDPNKMYIGQRVKVPFILDKTPGDIAFYRNRGRTWR
jgi:hypothetical protein